jgi:primosomal protein N'
MSKCTDCGADVYWVSYDAGTNEKHVCERDRRKFRMCAKCGGMDLRYVMQTFKNGTEHLKVTCKKCGNYLGYAPQVKEFIDLVEKKDGQTKLFS